MREWPQTPVEIRPATAPDGQRGVLVQLPDGYVVTSPTSARKMAADLIAAAEEAEADEVPDP